MNKDNIMLECELLMSKVEGNLQFLKGQTLNDWRGSQTEAMAIDHALDYLLQAKEMYATIKREALAQ
jgi:hypothetical protein|tara:strand:- start:311 stop:511 length:201 start_codon:yes stop_codon:yes gene_type:complete